MNKDLINALMGSLILISFFIFITVLTYVFFNASEKELKEIKLLKYCRTLCDNKVNKFVFNVEKNTIEECECK